MRKWFDAPRDSKQHARRQQTEPIRLRGAHLWPGTLALVAASVLLMVILSPGGSAVDEAPSAQAGVADAIRLKADCVVVQRLSYAPCGHELTRRVSLPKELSGKTREELAASYDGWQLTSYSAGEVRMEQLSELYCPQHTVLMCDEGGMLCVWQNTYGDAMSLSEELNIPVSDFPDDVQQSLRQGIGFDTRQALDSWLENAES